MKIIATSLSEQINAVLFDSATGETQLVPKLPSHKDEGFNDDIVSGNGLRPYGITWDEDNVFIGLRRHMIVYDNHCLQPHHLQTLSTSTSSYVHKQHRS